jgi:hypothetical protein
MFKWSPLSKGGGNTVRFLKVTENYCYLLANSSHDAQNDPSASEFNGAILRHSFQEKFHSSNSNQFPIYSSRVRQWRHLSLGWWAFAPTKHQSMVTTIDVLEEWQLPPDRTDTLRPPQSAEGRKKCKGPPLPFRPKAENAQREKSKCPFLFILIQGWIPETTIAHQLWTPTTCMATINVF